MLAITYVHRRLRSSATSIHLSVFSTHRKIIIMFVTACLLLTAVLEKLVRLCMIISICCICGVVSPTTTTSYRKPFSMDHLGDGMALHFS